MTRDSSARSRWPYELTRLSGQNLCCTTACEPAVTSTTPSPRSSSTVAAMTERLEEQQREVVIPSEKEFVARVRTVEQERAQATSHIEEQQEAAEAQERDIERMRVRDGWRSSLLQYSKRCRSIRCHCCIRTNNRTNSLLDECGSKSHMRMAFYALYVPPTFVL